MPFDGSGNFSRVYDWTDDRDNNIKIRADRMDGEFDDMAAAFNVVFFRNGLVPMTGDLSMGANNITGIASGSAVAPSIQFSVDPNTGLYLDGAGAIGFSANGTRTFEVNTTGAQVIGALNVSGASTLTGNTTVGGTLGVTGAATLAGTLGVTSTVTLAGNATVGGTFGVTGALTGAAGSFTSLSVGGSAVWTAANDGAGSGLDADLLDGLQGSAFAKLSADNVFTGSYTYFKGQTVLYAASPVLSFYNAGISTLFGSLTHDGTTLTIANAQAGTIDLSTTGAAVRVNGSTVWHAGNDGAGSGLDADLLDGNQAAAFALLSGATFTGNVGIGAGVSLSRPLNVFYDSAVVNQYGLVLQAHQGGYGTGISFQSALGTSGVVTEMARITADGANAWSSTDSATQDARLCFFTTLNGVASEKMRLSHDGVLTVGGSTVWHAGNDGAGSGLDADLLDGYHAASFALLAGATFTGAVSGTSLTLTSTATVEGGTVYLNAAQNRYIQWDGTNYNFAGTSLLASGNTVWHAGNDGAGSGLDADLLDGIHASGFIQGSGSLGTFSQGTAAPSGGSDGDTYFQYS